MLEYLYNQYFKSKNKSLKKYYFNLYLKEFFKKVKNDDTDLLNNYFNTKKDNYDLNIEKVIFDFETKHLNFILKIK
jgi:hypothetical protein